MIRLVRLVTRIGTAPSIAVSGHTLRGNGTETVMTYVNVEDMVTLLATDSYTLALMAEAVAASVRQAHDIKVLGQTIADAILDAAV